MNFKDAYKSYNDEIKGNPDVLDAILNGKPKPKQVVSFRPLMAYAAMAALVVSLSVFGFNKFYGEPKPTKNYIASNNIRLTDIDKTQVEDSGIEAANVETEDKVKQAPMQENQTSRKSTATGQSVTQGSVGSAKASSDTPENVSGANPITVSGANEPYTADNALPGETVAGSSEGMRADIVPPVNLPESKAYAGGASHVPAAIAEPEVIALPEQEVSDLAVDINLPATASENEATTGSSPMMARSGGGSSSVAAYSPETDGEVPAYSETESAQMSADEYFEYLGIDIISRAKLPEDMTFETPGEATVEYADGVIVSDMLTLEAYSAQNPQRSISLSVTKKGSYAGRFTDDISYAYTDDETVVGAYTAAGDVSLSLGVQNVTKEEINNLMKSLKTEE